MKANDCVTIEGGSEELILPYWGNLSDKIFVAAQRLCGRVSIKREKSILAVERMYPVCLYIIF